LLFKSKSGNAKGKIFVPTFMTSITGRVAGAFCAVRVSDLFERKDETPSVECIFFT
jgi:hypothetical protein